MTSIWAAMFSLSPRLCSCPEVVSLLSDHHGNAPGATHVCVSLPLQSFPLFRFNQIAGVSLGHLQVIYIKGIKIGSWTVNRDASIFHFWGLGLPLEIESRGQCPSTVGASFHLNADIREITLFAVLVCVFLPFFPEPGARTITNTKRTVMSTFSED